MGKDDQAGENQQNTPNNQPSNFNPDNVPTLEEIDDLDAPEPTNAPILEEINNLDMPEPTNAPTLEEIEQMGGDVPEPTNAPPLE